jgi:hypothetical protein
MAAEGLRYSHRRGYYSPLTNLNCLATDVLTSLLAKSFLASVDLQLCDPPVADFLPRDWPSTTRACVIFQCTNARSITRAAHSSTRASTLRRGSSGISTSDRITNNRPVFISDILGCQTHVHHSFPMLESDQALHVTFRAKYGELL